MNRFSIKKAAFLCCIFLATVVVAEAQELKAVNDTVRTGPLQTVKKNIIHNDVIPDFYEWRIIDASLPPVSQGNIMRDGDNIIFTPNLACRNTAFSIEYELAGIGIRDTAEIRFIISNYNMPVNIIDPDVECFHYMPKNIEFGIKDKFRTENNSKNGEPGSNNFIDGFTSPLVGDLNGDGKPEIVVMGLNGTSGSNAINAVGRYINIYNGQTGERIFQYDFTTLGTGYDMMQLTNTTPYFYHRAPSSLALADLDNDGIGEIVMCHTKSGRIVALKPVFDGNTITGMNKMWEGKDEKDNLVNFKAPQSSNTNYVALFGMPHPYVADLNGDGIPEVTVYNKIFNGATGRLLMSWQSAASKDEPLKSLLPTTTSGNSGLSNQNSKTPLNLADAEKIRGKAMTGRRTRSDSYSDQPIAVPAIVDIDGDGQQEIITGNRIHKFQFNSLEDHTKNTYYTIEGPQSVKVHEYNNNEAVYHLSDGFTRVADIDGDDKLDIVVETFGNEGNLDCKIVIYVWDIEDTNNVKACVSFGSDGAHGSFSIPFIGDINGKNDGYNTATGQYDKKLPEICILGGGMYINRANSYGNRTGVQFHPLCDEVIKQGATDNNTTGGTTRFNRIPANGKGHIIGLTWDAQATSVDEKLKVSWGMEHEDSSNSTGITLFDFDNNNTADLCYRDEKTLRVISPGISGKDYVELSEDTGPGSSIMFKTTVNSATGFEYPTIADVNMDGSADIIVTAIGSPSIDQTRSWIRVFEHDGQKWAPCPPVWNQGMYDPTQIREDLKINARPIPMLTKFKKDGEWIQPYNGSWIQHPIVREGDDYVPVVRKPDAIIMNMNVKVMSPVSTLVTLDIYNAGTASISAASYISFYDGGENPGKSLANSSFIAKELVGVDIFPFERKTLSYTIEGNFNNKLVWATILMDNNGNLHEGYDDCNVSNNHFSGADCPYLVYDITASPDAVLCGNDDDVLLTAVAQNEQRITPEYQWYRNGEPIYGATSPTYIAESAGTYQCYVIEGICRDFSASKVVVREMPVAIDDYIGVSSGVTTKVNILYNDNKSVYCNPMPFIKVGPKHAESCLIDAEGKVIYTSVAGYIGQDTLIYGLGESEAKVYFKVTNQPDNIINAGCSINTFPTTVWNIKEIPVNTGEEIYNYGPLTVGDIDDDDTVEIIGFIKQQNTSTKYESPGIKIFYFDENEQKMKLKTQFMFKGHTVSVFGSMAIARYDKKGYIVVAGTDGYLYAYDPDGNFLWNNGKSSHQYDSPNNCYGSIVSIANFNGDGVPEVYTGNSIFSLADGTRLCGGGNTVNRGKLPQYSGSLSFAANVTDDSKLELCAGNTIYRPDFTANSLTPLNTLPVSALPANAGADGATLVADIDNNGQLDIIVVTKDPTKTGASNTIVYVWTPEAGNGGSLIGYFKVPSTSIYYGIPAVGNIDDTPYPEIVFTDAGKMYALKYDPAGSNGNRITKKWEFNIDSDVAAGAGISLFDFNFDGTNEIVYRDLSSLYIIDGKDNAAVIKAKSDNVRSGVLREFPIIADIDNDGHTEIITTGHTSTNKASSGYLRVFKTGGSQWASTRKVWNQYAYNAVNIHENLIVPAEQFNIASELPGRTGSLSDNVRPFNSFMQQQTLMDENGVPLLLTPDVLFTGTVAFNHTDIGDSLTVGLYVHNDGNAKLQAPFYISTYKNGNIRIAVDSVMTPVNMGTTNQVTVTIRNFSTYPMNNISFVVNNKDGGPGVFVQTECDYTNNDTVFLYTSMLLAHNDYASTVATAPVVIDILSNDSIPAGSTPTISLSAKHGNATFTNNAVRYIADDGFTGRDTIIYSISSGENVSTAKVDVLVLKPLSMKYLACPGVKAKMGFASISGVGYYWYKDEQGGTAIAGPADELTVTKGKPAEDIGTWWVEPRMGNIVFQRYRVDLAEGDCGVTNAKSCAEDGTVIFRDNVTKKIDPGTFYQHRINDLCENTTLYFSASMANTCKTNGQDPNIRFELHDTDGNRLAIYYTGQTPCTSPATGLAWTKYGFQFDNTGNSSLIMQIYNDGGANSNDFNIDNIEIRLCAPKVNTNITDNDTIVCAGPDLDIIGTYISDCTFGHDIGYKWEFRPVNSSVWTTLVEDNATVDCNAADIIDRTVEARLSISSASVANTGYYRLFVSSAGNTGNHNCSAASDSIYVKVLQQPVTAMDLRIDVCPVPERQINLTKYVDSLELTTVNWVKVNAAPDILDAQSGTINSQKICGTHKYQYSLVSQCGTSSAIAYIYALKNRMHRKIDTIVICKEQIAGKSIHLNRILGFEFDNAEWSYPVDPDNAISSSMMNFPVSSRHRGAVVFDVQKAWSIATNTNYNINYKGDTNAKKFVFHYSVADSNCLGNVEKDIVIVVTEIML